ELIGRSPSAHKRNVGHVGVVGGAAGMVGAARLSGLASLRAGAGLATLVSTSAVIDRLEGQVLELMTARFPDAASDAEMNAPASEVLAPFDALVIGPGLGRDDSARVRARAALRVRKPTVLDADGLRAFEGRLEELRQHDSL